MINEIMEAVLLAQGDAGQLSAINSLAQAIPKLNDDDVDEILDRLLDFSDELQAVPLPASAKAESSIPIDQLLQPLMHQLARLCWWASEVPTSRQLWKA